MNKRNKITIISLLITAIGIVGLTETVKYNPDRYKKVDTAVAKKTSRSDLVSITPNNLITTNQEKSNVVKIDKINPTIQAEDVTINIGENINILDNVSAKDYKNNDITKDILVEGTVDANTIGTYIILLSVTDTWSNTVTKEKKINVIENIPSNVTFSITPTENESVVKNSTNDFEDSSIDKESITDFKIDNTTDPELSTLKEQESFIQNNESEKPTYNNSSMYIAGQTIPYQSGGQTYGQSIIDSNPNSMISTWGGAATQSGTDGQNTHFIGHNPGVFSAIFNVTNGDQIVVTDGNGAPTTYTVSSIFQVDHYAVGINDGVNYWDTITGTGGGERITLQACVNDTVNIIVIAYA